jgi:NtrC-family two-component system sensor histidine kinase KinB
MAEGAFGTPPESHVNLLLRLRESNDELLALIRNLIEVYRFEKDLSKIQKENTDLVQLVDAYLASMSPLLQDKQIEVLVNCSNIGAIQLEHNSILRVIQNLVENAIKFTPKGGRISIKLWHEEMNVYFQIADNGPGVPENERKQLFQRFYQGQRGKQSPAGTGLGLYLCRQIVEAHCGRIWCDRSGENGGATFTVSLPVGDAA